MNLVEGRIFGDPPGVSGDVGFRDLVAMLRKDELMLLIYQRDAVWSDGQISALWDSLLRGFPLPPFLVTIPSADHEASRPLSWDRAPRKQSVKRNPNGHLNVVDGQQRLMAIALGVGFGLEGKPSLRLWVDLAPPDKKHPLGFIHWIHPCSKAFPFGYRMEAGSEHDFAPLRDSDLAEIWKEVQNKERDIHQTPLRESWPYHATCPLPLDELIELVIDGTHEWTMAEFAQKVHIILEDKKISEKPPEDAVERLFRALLRLPAARFAFQKLTLPDSKDDPDAEITLFERLGRGGVEITQRQLAVSRILRELDWAGNDAVANFLGSANSVWRTVLDTEEVIHAVARVAYAEVPKEPLQKDNDLLELNLQRLTSIKTDGGMWDSFSNKLTSWCAESADSGKTQLQAAFETVLDALAFEPVTNPHGIPLVQMAYSSSTPEGIRPVTLHPLLRWTVQHYPSPPTCEVRDEMVRWILFANGVVTAPTNSILQKYAFFSVIDGVFSFDSITEKIFQDTEESRKLRRDIGFAWDFPEVNGDIVSSQPVDHLEIPPPEKVGRLFLQRLFLQNWVSDRVNSFLLMWSQRAALHELYGAQINDLPALFSKGRPFDRDHIVARNRLLGDKELVTDDHIVEASIRLRVQIRKELPGRLTTEQFRKKLSDAFVNSRYWPRYLNRSDGRDRVEIKMSATEIEKKLEGHPLERHFKGCAGNLPWQWSAIPEASRDEWTKLPPEKWDGESVASFIRCLRDRQLTIYGEAYRFLTERNGYVIDDTAR